MQSNAHAPTLTTRRMNGEVPLVGFHGVNGYHGGMRMDTAMTSESNISVKRNSMGLNFTSPQAKRTRVASLSDLAIQELASPNSANRFGDGV